MNIKKSFFPLFVLIAFISGCGSFGNSSSGDVSLSISPSTYVDVYETNGTGARLFARRSSIELSTETHSNPVVEILTDKQYQEILGFGAALTHSAASVLMEDTIGTYRAQVLRDFFSSDGANYSAVRIPIGSSDYIAESEYFSCDDNGGNEDLTLEHFTLEHDEEIITVLKEIIAINPDVQIMAAPWSAPAWMKTTSSLIGGALKDDYVDVYAAYLARFVSEYALEGINITHLSIINEPNASSLAYPYMRVDSEMAIRIISALKLILPSTVDISIYDHNTGGVMIDYIDAEYKNADVNSVSKTIALHNYNTINQSVSDACAEIASIYPDKGIWVSEYTEHKESIDFAANLVFTSRQVSVEPINSGLIGGIYWNMALHANGTPGLGNDKCYGLTDFDVKVGGEVQTKYKASYYAMMHTAKFLGKVNGSLPRALRIESEDSNIVGCAFVRGDGEVVLVLCNTNDQINAKMDIKLGDAYFEYDFNCQTVVSFVYKGGQV